MEMGYVIYTITFQSVTLIVMIAGTCKIIQVITLKNEQKGMLNFLKYEMILDSSFESVLLLGMGKTTSNQQSGNLFTLDFKTHLQILSIPPLPPRDNLLRFHLHRSMIVCGSIGNDVDSFDCLCYSWGATNIWITQDKTPRFNTKQAASQVLQYKDELNQTVTKLWVSGGAVTQSNQVTLVLSSTQSLLLEGLNNDGQIDCLAKNSNRRKSGKDMPRSLADHCTLVVHGENVFVTGGYTLEGFIVKNSYLYNSRNDSWQILADMRQARKQHACTKFITTTGFEVAVVAGGEGDNQEGLLASCEIFYLDTKIGQWARMHHLPIELTMPSMVSINNRLILSGGINDGIVQDAIWLYDEKSGWHFFNQRLHTAMYAHTNTLWTKEDFSNSQG